MREFARGVSFSAIMAIAVINCLVSTDRTWNRTVHIYSLVNSDSFSEDISIFFILVTNFVVPIKSSVKRMLII